ncbi:MAG: carboxymuconolactone decarboxylase family protein [Alphaproteobacteria bacterium]|nr:carboxymuconolactone decarboxylase family protein [Alphaproteobacteria bacterium]
MLFLGGNAMAENALNAKQKSIAEAAAYAARGNQAGLKQALSKGLDNGVSVNEFKEILVQTYAYCGFCSE